MPGTTDTVKAMLTPGEFVIRKEAVDMIGVPILEKLNDMPEAGGHSEIDRLIAMATLKNMTGMYGGGMVNAKQYMGGGKVDMYGHGGKVKNQMMMGYEHGGEAHGNLKPVPDDNPGLAKLPEKVRNKMGYMQEGGMAYIDPVDSSIVVMSPEQSKMADEIMTNIKFPVKTSRKYRLETLIDILNNPDLYGMNKKDSSLLDSSVKNMELEFYKDILESPKAKLKEDSLMGMMYGGKAKKKKKYGYQEGGEILGLNITPESVFQAVYQMPTDDGDRYYLGEAQRPLPNLSRKLSIKRARDKAMNAPQDSITFDMAQQILNPEEEKGGFLKKLLGMQEGGAVQDDAMMLQYLQSLQAQQANPFVPFDQRPLSSGEMMSPIPSGMEQGDMMRIIRDEREVLDMEDAELLRQKAQNALIRFKLDSIINAEGLQPERLERMPADTSGFIPSSPMFSPKGMGI
jgi:hypothetical protein